ncbi:hypothetical protein G6F40_015466 [Rhizopus arrhizus]|nr:hypothetical protein G6F40_015466 [Rhizopus arrhizus]
MRNRGVESWLQTNSSRLITGVVEDQRQLVRQHLVRGMATGTNPRQTALELVGRVGETGRRSGAAGERRSGADGGVLRPQAARQAPGRDRQPGHQGRPAGGAGRRREDRRALCGPAAGAAWRDDRAHRVADGHGRR